jgi:hypothetical protein
MSKRLSRQRIFDLGNNNNRNRDYLYTIKYPVPILLADCEIYLLSRLPTIQWGAIRRYRAQYLIQNSSQNIDLKELALSLYVQVLLPFSTLICIFSDDFRGTIKVARFLAS